MSKGKGHDGQHKLRLVHTVSILQEEETAVNRENGQLHLFKMGQALEQSEPIGAKLSALQRSNKELLDKNNRLSNTVTGLQTKINDHVVGEREPDLVISHSQDLDKADVAYVRGSLPAEASYPYLTSKLADLVQMTATRLGLLFRKAGIKGDNRYHHEMETGRTSRTQKYRATALKALYDLAVDGKVHGITEEEITRLKTWQQIVNASK